MKRGGGMAVGRFIDREACMLPVAPQTAAQAEVDIMRVVEGCAGDVEVSRHDTRPRCESGEKSLMLAVMERAYRDLYSEYEQRGRKLAVRGVAEKRTRQRQVVENEKNARSWFESDDDTWPHSFVNICRVFDWEPTWVRELVLAGAPAGVHVKHVVRFNRMATNRPWQQSRPTLHRVVAPRERARA